MTRIGILILITLLAINCNSITSSNKIESSNLSSVDGSIQVMFHPTDATLEEIAKYFEEAQSTIDFAIYNFDTSSSSPIIKALSSTRMQSRIESGELEVRAIYQGYKKPTGNQTTLQANEAACIVLEDLGVDVRRFIPGEDPRWQSAVKVHHKYAIIDGYTQNPRLVTGSANWSRSSREKYDENILFIQDVKELTNDFQKEFNLLWATSAEYGGDLSEDPQGPMPVEIDIPGVDAYFNSSNYEQSGGALSLNNNVLIKHHDQKYVLTNKIVEAIDQAEISLEIATTRITLRDVIDAVGRAVNRGVDVEIVLNMDQYKTSSSSAIRKLVTNGADVKVKFYNLAYDRSTPSGRPTYLDYQMHSKYLIADGKKVFTGSFNWSNSGEYNHLENLVEINTENFPNIQSRYLDNFKKIQTLNSEKYSSLEAMIQARIGSNSTVGCKFPEPMTLSVQQIDGLLELGRSRGVTLKDDCRIDWEIR